MLRDWLFPGLTYNRPGQQQGNILAVRSLLMVVKEVERLLKVRRGGPAMSRGKYNIRE